MISALSLRNYQVWRDLDLRLGSFTAVVGPSGYGKSSIIRAMQALFSCPPGLANVTHGAVRSEIALSLADDQPGPTVLWEKSADINLYRVSDHQGKVTTFDKVGRSVPEKILQLFNLPIVSIDGHDHALYLHAQFDPPYLLFEPPPAAARILMAVTGVDRLTDVQKQVASDRKESAASLKATKTSIESIETDPVLLRRVKALSNYDELRPQLLALVSKQESLVQLQVLIQEAPPRPGQRIEFPDTALYARFLTQRTAIPVSVTVPCDRVDYPTQEFQAYDEVRANLAHGPARAAGDAFLHLVACAGSKGALPVLLAEAQIALAESMLGVCPLCGQEVSV